MIDDDEEPLVDRLLDEADLCASEGAFDIARLLTEAATACRVRARHNTLAMNAAAVRIALKNAGICPDCYTNMMPGHTLEQTAYAPAGELLESFKCPQCGFSTTKGKS